jgi:hypothetical protein
MVSVTTEDINTFAVDAVSRNDSAIDLDREANIRARYIDR